jgi:hypothetical protein
MDIFVNWKNEESKFFQLPEKPKWDTMPVTLPKSLTDRPEVVLPYENKVHDLPE